MGAVEATDYIAGDGVDHRLCGLVVYRFNGGDALLDDDAIHLLTFLDGGHAGALFAVQAHHLGRVTDGHDAHAVGAVVGLEDGIRGGLDIVFPVFVANLPEQLFAAALQALFAFAFHEVDLTAVMAQGLEEPGVAQLQIPDKGLGDVLVVLKVTGLGTFSPAVVRGWDDGLADALQQLREAAGQIIVQDDEFRFVAVNVQDVVGTLQFVQL